MLRLMLCMILACIPLALLIVYTDMQEKSAREELINILTEELQADHIIIDDNYKQHGKTKFIMNKDGKNSIWLMQKEGKKHSLIEITDVAHMLSEDSSDDSTFIPIMIPMR